MSPVKVLVANRGEVAVRVLRACAELGLGSVAVYSEDDAAALHAHRPDQAIALKGQGVAAYLDGDGILAAAREAGADALHPGYGFLSENADFARQCLDAGIAFIGPTPEMLELFGDKSRARALASDAGVGDANFNPRPYRDSGSCCPRRRGVRSAARVARHRRNRRRGSP